jgi:hypothetical protein
METKLVDIHHKNSILVQIFKKEFFVEGEVQQ